MQLMVVYLINWLTQEFNCELIVIIVIFVNYGELNPGRANTVVWGPTRDLMECINQKCVLIAGLALLFKQRDIRFTEETLPNFRQISRKT